MGSLVINLFEEYKNDNVKANTLIYLFSKQQHTVFNFGFGKGTKTHHHRNASLLIQPHVHHFER